MAKGRIKPIYVGERDENGVLKRAYEGIDMREVYRKKPLYYKFLKRLFDIIGSLLAMIILSPVFLNATTDGVVLFPSGFGITVGSPPSYTATQEFVVPKSIPMILLLIFSPVENIIQMFFNLDICGFLFLLYFYFVKHFRFTFLL